MIMQFHCLLLQNVKWMMDGVLYGFDFSVRLEAAANATDLIQELIVRRNPIANKKLEKKQQTVAAVQYKILYEPGVSTQGGTCSLPVGGSSTFEESVYSNDALPARFDAQRIMNQCVPSEW